MILKLRDHIRFIRFITCLCFYVNGLLNLNLKKIYRELCQLGLLFLTCLFTCGEKKVLEGLQVL